MPQSRNVINFGEKGLGEIASKAVAWNSKANPKYFECYAMNFANSWGIIKDYP